MIHTICPTCREHHCWSWEEAFDKFGFGDGDGLVMTHRVADALRKHGYVVVDEPWSVHNVVITSIKTAKGKEQIPKRVNLGYDDPRDYLPKSIIKLLDETFAGTREVAP